jgi:plasmid stabilization system protein ParE
MPYDIIWLKNARGDMNALFEFYRTKSHRAALHIHNGIIDETDRLANNPFMAPLEPSVTKPSKIYRSLTVSKGRFKVIYFVEDTTVYIARVWGCPQNRQNLNL